MGVTHDGPTVSKADEIVRTRVRWHRHVLGALAIWSLMFVANEAFRISTMHRVEELNTDGQCESIVRYVTLEEDAPTSFRKLAERLGGEYWNQDFCSVVIYASDEPLDDELITNVTRLRRLSTLQINGGRLTERQLYQLSSMKNLQWLALSYTNADQAVVTRLRTALPNTFVTVL